MNSAHFAKYQKSSLKWFWFLVLDDIVMFSCVINIMFSCVLNIMFSCVLNFDDLTFIQHTRI